MSRFPSNTSQTSNGTSRLKISAPQPYQPPPKVYPASGGQSGGPPGGTNGTDGGSRRANDAPTGSGPAKPGPMRPARSIRRAPNPPATSSSYRDPRGTSAGSSRYPDDLSASGLAPQAIDETPISPIEPSTPGEETSAGAMAWDFERNQRNQMLEAQQEQSGREGRLRDVVGAFTTARTAGKRADDQQKRRKQTREGREEELFIGNGSGQFSDIDSVLRQIQRDWPGVLDRDFAPSSLALSLISSSTRSGSHPPLREFLALHAALSSALQRAVQKHYQTYASSLPEHAQLLSALSRAQGLVRETKKQLLNSKDLLSGGVGDVDDATPQAGLTTGKRAEMGSLWNKERTLKDMLKTLDVIEHLKKIPDKLESLIGDKRFLQASHVLMRSLKAINKEDMREIGALSELRTYLQSQQQTLADILIEELHNHLYLKSFYCDSRWVPYQPGQTEILTAKYDREVEEIDDVDGSSRPSKPTSRLSHYLDQLSLKPPKDPMLDITDTELASLPAIPVATHRRGGSAHGMNSVAASIGSLNGLGGVTNGDQASGKPLSIEADSFAYMEMLLESLAALAKLNYAVDIVTQRIAGELHSLVEAVIEEVDERRELRQIESQWKQARPQSAIISQSDGAIGETSRPSSMVFASAPNLEKDTAMRLSGLETAGSPMEAETLRDLFWTVYAKLHAVVEGHRVVYEIINRISSRRDFMSSQSSSKSASLYANAIAEVWKPMQTEVRSLLSAYLTNQDQGVVATRTPLPSINEVLRDGKLVRDKQRAVFKFSDTDNRLVNKELSIYDDELNKSLKVSVPGLVLTAAGDLVTSAAPVGADERISTAGRHRLLVRPSPFNVSIIFRPYVAFISTVKDVIPAGFAEESENFGSVLDNFVVRVYLPQLEEKVTSLFQVAITGVDAFERERSPAETAGLPIAKSCAQVMAIVNSLCVMLATTPFNKEDYSRLIIGVIVRYYQRCSTHYRDLVVTDNVKADNPLSLSATWAQREEIIVCLDELLRSDSGDHDGSPISMHAHETRLEMALLDNKAVTKADLIKSNKHIESLVHLSYSIRWLVRQLTKLKQVSDEMLSPSFERHQRESLYYATEEDAVPALILSTAMSDRLEAILSTYTQLADLILSTIRIEVRTRAMAFIHASLSKGNYRIDADSLEPDPYITDWTYDLSDIDAAVSGGLPPDERRFVFGGLGDLINQLLVTCGRSVRYVTSHGVKKIERNMLAVQQALRNVVDRPEQADLAKAREYWSLFAQGPKAMLEMIQQTKGAFSFDDYNHMLALQCKVDPKASARLSGQAGSRLSNGAGASSLNSERAALDPERDAYNGYLIELHSLAMGMGDFQ